MCPAFPTGSLSVQNFWAPPCFQFPPSLLCSQCFHFSYPSLFLTSCQPGRIWPTQVDWAVYTCCWVFSTTNLISRGVQAVCPGIERMATWHRPRAHRQAGKQLGVISLTAWHRRETLCCSNFCAQVCWFRISLVVESQCVQQISALVFSSHLQLSLQAAKSRNCTSGFLRHCTDISNLAFCVWNYWSLMASFQALRSFQNGRYHCQAS